MKGGERRSSLPPNKFLVMVLMMVINDIVLYVVAQWGLTPLHIGAFTGNRDIVAELLRQGCDVNAVTSRGETALHYAVRCGQPNIASLVLDDTAGANIINATTFNVSLSSAAFYYFIIITALHGMQTRSSDEKAVRPSVCPSNA